MAANIISKKPDKRGRPIKARIVTREPGTKQFSPRGRIGRPGYKALKFEEIESIRLIDYMGLDQREAAKLMGVSQQTFSRVLRKCRKTLTEALINGEIIKVQGGDYRIEKRR
ncbi:MAG: DUF134 domain-containing protein [Candidatus Omnitrophota bacterium]